MDFINWSLYEGMGWPFLLVFVFIGALIGSFFNVLSQRWPAYQINANDEQSKMWITLRGHSTTLSPKPTRSLMGDRSQCPQCDTPIPLFRNIPLFSWIIQRGRSACCQAPISLRYLAFEFVGAFIFTLIALTLGPTTYGLVLGITAMVLVLIAVIDLSDGLIPDALLMWLAVGIYLCASHQGHWIDLTAALSYHLGILAVVMVIMGLMSLLAGKGVMGSADQHLLALVGALLGQVFYLSLAVIVVGLVITASLVRSGALKRGLFAEIIDAKRSVPAGPAICLGALLGIMYIITGV